MEVMEEGRCPRRCAELQPNRIGHLRHVLIHVPTDIPPVDRQYPQGRSGPGSCVGRACGGRSTGPASGPRGEGVRFATRPTGPARTGPRATCPEVSNLAAHFVNIPCPERLRSECGQSHVLHVFVMRGVSGPHQPLPFTAQRTAALGASTPRAVVLSPRGFWAPFDANALEMAVSACALVVPQHLPTHLKELLDREIVLGVVDPP